MVLRPTSRTELMQIAGFCFKYYIMLRFLHKPSAYMGPYQQNLPDQAPLSCATMVHYFQICGQNDSAITDDELVKFCLCTRTYMDVMQEI
jgi:hypothetical protein